MPPQIELSFARGDRAGADAKSLTLPSRTVVLGAGADADIRVRDGGLLAQHLRFVITGFGRRVEPVRPGGTVTVNGEELFCKDLDLGDVIEVGDLELRWLESQHTDTDADASSAPDEGLERGVAAATVATRRASPRRAARVPRRRGATWLSISSVFLVVALTIVVVLRSFAGSTWPHSPQHYVDLARAQFGNQQTQHALDTLAFALRDATGDVREQALALQALIVREQLERTQWPRIDHAMHEHDLLLSFVQQHCATSSPRPAARESARMAERWLQQHGELCRQHSRGGAMVTAVEEVLRRMVGPAALSDPDTDLDVIFAAHARLRFRWRDYVGAMALLDAFLGQQESEVVRTERARLLDEGAQWLAVRLRSVDNLLDRGDLDNAGIDLERLAARSVLPAWQEQVDGRVQRLQAARSR